MATTNTKVKTRGGLSGTILSAIGIFGSSEMIRILCSIVRVKCIALWIGAAGMGLFGLYNLAIEMLSSVTQLGLRNSAVREIAEVKDDPRRLGFKAKIVKSWGLILGCLGAVVAIVFAPVLSLIAFGSTDNAWAFMVLSVVLLINTSMSAEQAVIQGMGRMGALAKCSIFGSVASLLVSLPMLYIWKIDSIIPVIVAYTVVAAIAVLIYKVRGLDEPRRVTVKDLRHEGKEMLTLGSYLTVTGLITWGVGYLFLSYLNHVAGTETMGLYQAGYTLVVNYVGVVFSAIGMEFYPRMSAIGKENRVRTGVLMWHEASMIVLVVLPIVVLLPVLAQWVVRLLYSSEFLPIVPYIAIASVGCLLRGVSWCLSFIIIVRGDGRIYLLTEAVSGVVCFAASALGYHFGGLAGIGVAFVVWYAIYATMVWCVVRFRYGIATNHKVAWQLAGALLASVVIVGLTLGLSLWVALVPALGIALFCGKRILRIYGVGGGR